MTQTNHTLRPLFSLRPGASALALSLLYGCTGDLDMEAGWYADYTDGVALAAGPAPTEPAPAVKPTGPTEGDSSGAAGGGETPATPDTGGGFFGAATDGFFALDGGATDGGATDGGTTGEDTTTTGSTGDVTTGGTGEVTTGGTGDVTTGGTGETTTGSTGEVTTGGSGEVTTGGSSGPQDPEDEVRAYFFGHSLVEYADAPSVGVSMCGIASEAGDACCGNGRYPETFFPSAFVGYGAPTDSQNQGPGCWTDSFAASGFTDVIVTEANFYWQNPIADHVEGLVYFVNNLRSTQGYEGDIYLYEHWPEFAGSTTFSSWKNSDYLPYFQWFAEIQSEVNAQVSPRVRMVPVGWVFSQLLREIPAMAALTQEDLFVDDAPHGNATPYFISGLVHYMVLYRKPPPTDAAAVAAISSAVSPAVRNNYAAIVNMAWSTLQEVNDENGQSLVF